MSESSSRMRWPYPSEGQDPFFATYQAQISAQDASAFALVENQNIFIMAGGTITWAASSGLLSWATSIELNSAQTGFKWSISPGSITLADGECFYVDLSHNPVVSTSVVAAKASKLPSTGLDTVLLLGVRNGARVYFRGGKVIQDGESTAIFETGGGGVSNHEALTGLQGGQLNQHYHLTNTEHTAVGTISSKANAAVTLTAGNGLTGGGDLSANRTFAVQAADSTVTVDGTGVKVNAIAESQVTNLVSDLSAKATDSAVVHNTGNENVAGVKTFSSSPLVPVATLSGQAVQLGQIGIGANGVWTTYADLDFSTQLNQTLTGDGAHVVGGLTWNKGNSANEASTMQVVNGSGLEIHPTSTTKFDATGITLPYLDIALSALYPALDWSTLIRVTIYESSNATADFDSSVYGIWNANHSAYSVAVIHGHYGAPSDQYLFRTIYDNVVYDESTLFAALGYDVGRLSFDDLGRLAASFQAGVYSAGFPTETDYHLGGVQVTSTSVATALTNGTPIKAGDLRLFLGAFRNGSGTSLTTIIKRVKVEVFATGPLGALGNIPESQVTNLVTDLGNKVDTSRTITAGNGLTGGGNLSANRTLTVLAEDSTITVGAAGIKVNAITESQVTNLVTDLSAKAADAAVVHNSGNESVGGVKTFTSSPIVPDPTNNTDAANKQWVVGQLGSAGASWHAYDLDFTAQGSQTFSSNTNYTIDGKTWTVGNQGNSSVFDILNGTGLRISPNAGTNYYGGAASQPYIKIKLSDLYASIDWDTPIRVSIYSTDNQAANYDQTYVGISTADLITMAFWAISGHDSGQSVNRIYSLSGELNSGTPTGASNTTLFGGGYDVMTLDLSDGLGKMSAYMQVGTSVAGALPARTTMKAGSKVLFGSGQTPYYSGGVPVDPGDMVLWLGNVKVSSGTAFQSIYKKLKVEVFY